MKIAEIETMISQLLTDSDEVRAVLHVLLNLLAEQYQTIEEQKKEIQELKDEINLLKGEQKKPEFKAKKKSDISSNGKEKGKDDTDLDDKDQADNDLEERKKKNKNNKRGNREVAIDREVLLTISKEDLPPDAIIKTTHQVVVQNILFKRDNVKYTQTVYYSAITGQTYEAPLPTGVSKSCLYGSDLLSFISILPTLLDVTQGNLHKLLTNLGLSISTGTLNNLWLKNAEWAIAEQEAILQAGISTSDYVQIDATSNKEAGKSMTTQILTGALFVVYNTFATKSRLDVLRAVQGHPQDDICLSYNLNTQKLLLHYKISAADRSDLARLFSSRPKLSPNNFRDVVAQELPKLYAKPNIFHKIEDCFALGHYHTQTDFPIIQNLLSDAAPEYNQIAATSHALCWVHDARYYHKLVPIFDSHKTALKNFKKSYWAYYDKVLAFKNLSVEQQTIQIPLLEAAFDTLFATKTQYEALDKLIQKTAANKQQLLVGLYNSAVPLHNNNAELGARRIVRKRDASLHTMSTTGTRVRDAMLTICQTAAKCGVSIIDYIADRIARTYLIKPLAFSVANP